MKKVVYNKGFTLIELMIVLAIISILAALAYPAYSRYVDRARRPDATDALLQMAAQQERNYSRLATYANTVGLGYGGLVAGWATTGAGTYRFRVAPATVPCPITTCYLLQAQPIGNQARDLWEFQLSSTGQKQSRRGAAAAWELRWPEAE